MVDYLLKLFKIQEEEIIQTEKITPEDLILVQNESTKKLYLYRGRYSPNLDQFQSSILYERITNRFLNPNVFLIKSLIISDQDLDEDKDIKRVILDHFPNLKKYEMRRIVNDFFTLKQYRLNLKNFRNYENSHEWRSKLSNLSNIWRLNLFNLITLILIGAIISYNLIQNTQNIDLLSQNSNLLSSTLWQVWIQRNALTLILCLIILIFLASINLIFILFPLKFPISPNAIILPKLKSGYEIETPVLPPKESTGTPKANIPPIKINLTQAKDLPITKSSTEDYDDNQLNIPQIPAKKALNAKVDKINLDIPNLDEIAKKDTATTKNIVIEDTFIKKNIVIPIPRKMILDAKEPVVEISYIYNEPLHSVVVQLDHDFQVRRCRVSPVIFEDKPKK